jgi:TRAP-type mannitol/chloroaromatic compound transport system permease small subunit
MPELSFVLPHWLYWSGLIMFPLAAWFLYRRSLRRPPGEPVSLGLGYFLLLTGGFLGVHRLYVKSRWAFAFVFIFVVILIINVETREARETYSEASNAQHLVTSKISRAEKAIAKAEKRLAERDTERRRQALERAQTRLKEARAGLAEKQQLLAIATEHSAWWNNLARLFGLLLLGGIILDAFLLPRLVKQCNEKERGQPEHEIFQCPVVEEEHDDSQEPFLFNRVISQINGFAGELVAYWSVIAVFVYYYEVIARYVFNSPTNWAHEAMFLMFGMQYLIAGGFCLRENAHVRVDVIYSMLSKRTQAILDVITSSFFLIFVITLMVTGWIFFHDAMQSMEVSNSEWHIQYWPIKFALPLGAALLLIQGIANLVKDIAVALHPEVADLDNTVRPEG